MELSVREVESGIKRYTLDLNASDMVHLELDKDETNFIEQLNKNGKVSSKLQALSIIVDTIERNKKKNGYTELCNSKMSDV